MEVKELFSCKVRLLKVLGDGTEHQINSGNVIRFCVGEPVVVGSISSRDWWYTTPMQSFEHIAEDELHFKTLNSHYKIVPLHTEKDDE